MSFEEKLEFLAQQMNYPPTPALGLRQQKAARVWPRLAVLVAILATLLAVLVTVPQARAALADILHIGGIEIRFTDETPASVPALQDVVQLAGPTTLTKAAQTASFELRYPAQLGEPTAVYLQQWNDRTLVIMVWRDEQAQIEAALYQMHGAGFLKNAPFIEMTEVAGQRAGWIREPHLFSVELHNSQRQDFLVNEPVLVWEQDSITYRLEGHFSQQSAVELAADLIPVHP